MLDQLLPIALIGTSRDTAGAALTSVEGALGDALNSITPQPAESRILSSAALLSAYARCGRKPQKSDATAKKAEADERHPASPKSAALLEQLLGGFANQQANHLIAEWLAAATRAKLRAPHRLLPRLLDYAAGHRAARDAVVQCIDRRGQWLVQQNPKWQFAARADEQADPSLIWGSGNRAERLSALRALRESAPHRAIELIRLTWAQDGADDRAEFVGALSNGLSDADEPFLELALDDRSRNVRAAAAELLARLPRSGFVRRMIERANAMLLFQRAASGSLLKLKRGKSAQLDVALPPEPFDKQWLRDGIAEKPPAQIGKRQWWLLQVIAFVPPTHWSQTWSISPEECVRAVTSEFGDIILEAWSQASARHPSAQWARALLLGAPRRESGSAQLASMSRLPEADRLAVVGEVLESSKFSFDDLSPLFDSADFSLDRRSADALVERIEQRVRKSAAYDYALHRLLEVVSLRIPPELYDKLVERWHGDAWDSNRKALEQFLSILSLRRQIQQEVPK